MKILPRVAGAVAALLYSAAVLAVAPPVIDVAPTSLSSTLPPDTVETQTLTIANLGGSDLNLNILEDDSACESPTDIPWLSVAPDAATIPPGGSASVNVTFDSTGLAPGAYSGNLCVNSDDPVTPVVVVPVSLTVEPPVIDVAPASLSSTLFPDSLDTQVLTIANLGGANLNLNILEDDSVCESPTDIPWLSVAPDAATIPPGGAASVNVTFDSTGLAPGAYAGYLCVNSDDPVTPVVVVPVSLTVELAVIEVAVDIRPGSCPNPLNCKSKGVLPVAILGTAELDVTTIDPVTVRLAGAYPLRYELEDVATPFRPLTGKQDCFADCYEMGRDGYLDMTLKFDVQEIVAALGRDVEDGDCVVVPLTGQLLESAGGTQIVGEDVLRIICKAGGGSRRR